MRQVLRHVSSGLGIVGWRRTLERLHGFALCSLLPDTSEYRLQQFWPMRLDLFIGIARHQDVCVGSQALGAAFGRTALQIGDLLDAHAELGLPLLLRYLDIFAVEDLVDGVGAVNGRVSAIFALRL